MTIVFEGRPTWPKAIFKSKCRIKLFKSMLIHISLSQVSVWVQLLIKWQTIVYLLVLWQAEVVLYLSQAESKLSRQVDKP